MTRYERKRLFWARVAEIDAAKVPEAVRPVVLWPLVRAPDGALISGETGGLVDSGCGRRVAGVPVDMVLRHFVNRLLVERQVLPLTGCWTRSGMWSPDYDRATWRTGRVDALHRLVYVDLVGLIPAGFVVAHRCDVRCCWRPSHLFACSQAENVADMVRKGRSAKDGSVSDLDWARFTAAEAAARLERERFERECYSVYQDLDEVEAGYEAGIPRPGVVERYGRGI